MFQDSEPLVRAAAAKSAGDIGSLRFVGELQSLLNDHTQSWFVRFYSAQALGKIGYISTLSAIGEIMSGELTVWLGIIEGSNFIPSKYYSTVLLAPPGPSISEILAETLEKIGTPEAIAAATRLRRGEAVEMLNLNQIESMRNQLEEEKEADD